MAEKKAVEFNSPLQHGRDCPKVEHHGTGYLHAADHDGPYDVDGIWYCGRCHGWLGSVPTKVGT